MAITSALDGLNPAQRQVAAAGDGPILVIAGAGSGKTRTLVHRVAWLLQQGVNAWNILLLTFTRRAAQEMLSRAYDLHPASRQVGGGTFHSLCHRLLRQYGDYLSLPPSFTIIDRGDGESLLRALIADLGLKDKNDRHFPKAGAVLDLISKGRNLELAFEETVDMAAPHLSAYMDSMQALAREYAVQKLAQGLLDYDDLLYFTHDLLAANPGLGRELGRRWRYLLIDEYQDTNAVQDRLVRLLACGHQNVMAVGDDAQSIYRFRGARIANILNFSAKFDNCQIFKLEQNYRSTQPILNLTNHIIAMSRQGFGKQLFTGEKGGETPFLLRPRGEREQSQTVIDRLRRLQRQGVGLRQIAVLFRASRDSYQLEIDLGGAQIPFVKVGGFRFLESGHIKDALAHLRVLANPADFISWQRVLSLLPGIGGKRAKAIIARFSGAPCAYLDALKQLDGKLRLQELIQLFTRLTQPALTPLQAVRAVLDYYEPICREHFEDYPHRLRDLAEIPGLAEAYGDLDSFMADVVLEPPSARAETHEDYLTLSTIHSAKGLEWEHVFILWAAQGRFPAAPALQDAEALEEERRLMYVACTRAGKSLTICAPRQHYSAHQGLSDMEVSCFLQDIPAGLLAEESLAPRPSAFASAPRAPVFTFAASKRAPAPASAPARPFALGALVEHREFGQGKVMGYKGEAKILVHFQRFGLKILLWEYAGLTISGAA